MNRGLLRSVALLAALALLGQRASAQIALPDEVYRLYLSSSTPPQYKRIVSQIVWMNARAAGQAVRPAAFSPTSLSPSAASVSPASAQALAADPAFTFRDFYTFPNPVRRSEKPTIRVQVGLADSVDLRIYDIASELIHRASLSSPQIIDDGNGKGPQYTYDYTWDSSWVGSGVYVCAVTAKKGGQADITRIRKIGILK